MKRMMILMLLLLMVGVASMNAQVRIGGDTTPNTSAVLDLNATDTKMDGTLGLALPRVELTATTNFAPLSAHVKGMTVYNTKTINDVTPGTYINDGGKWIRVAGALDGAPVITKQPKAFTFHRLRDTDGDPNGPAASATATTLTVEASNATGYKWYRKATVVGAADVQVATIQSYTYTPADVNVANWGLYQFYCVVSNASGSVKSDLAEIALGCGAKTNDGRWLKFMCHNLGAATLTTSQSLDDVTFAYGDVAADTTSIDAKGWWFQWGRKADGHQWRDNSAAHTIAGPDTLTLYDGSVTAKRAGKFITNSNLYTFVDWHWPQYDYYWRNWNDGRFPCPSGWRIPTSSDWGSIYTESGSYGSPAQATANKWTWKTGTSTTGTGYKIQPDGATTTLYIPAAGYKSGIGAITQTGTNGFYWAATSTSTGAFTLQIARTRISPAHSAYRALGASVRCVAE
jgi:uncharacterized protein (TIGR02145 family)